MPRKYREYSDQDVIDNAKHVTTIAGLLRKLDLKCAGGNFIHMKYTLQRLNVDTSHWLGRGWSKDKQLKDFSEYTKGHHAKKHLIKLNGHKCQECKLKIWLTRPIPLEVHHKDGDRTNNILENLVLICPNCHAFTDNWRKPNF